MTDDRAAVALEIDHVTKRYGKTVAVDDANIAVRDNEFFAILGPSGSGKTTLLRLIAGFVAPESGYIRINGQDVTDTPPYRRPCNTVFQHYALFPHLSVADNLAFGLVERRRPKQEISQRVAAMLELVRLKGLEHRRPSQLSGGQQQRVALARALINDPAVLLLDEPLGALDAKLRRSMQVELKRIQREVGMTFIYVTHDQEEALTMADRVAVMHEGVIEQSASPREIYESPSSAFVGGFVGAGVMLDVEVTCASGNSNALVVRLVHGGESVQVPGDLSRWSPGRTGKLLLRPEELAIDAGDSPPFPNAVRGILDTTVFQGSTVRFIVTREDSPDIEILASARETPDVALGQSVWVSWASTSGRLLQ